MIDMGIRTDLALEAHEVERDNVSGISIKESRESGMKITSLRVLTDSAAARLGKEKGTYITCEFKALTDEFTAADKRLEIIGDMLRKLVPEDGCVLVVGIGNHNITPDALGPKAASKVLATRHIAGATAKSLGLEKLRSVCVLSPGVLGQTGLEVHELLKGIIRSADISCVIAVDALASRKLKRLGCTVQISDSGIAPGAGVGNNRSVLNRRTLGIPVISVGVPTVVDAATLASDLLGEDDEQSACLRKIVPPSAADMVVTPREIDLLTERASLLIGMAINVALQPELTAEVLFQLI